MGKTLNGGSAQGIAQIQSPEYWPVSGRLSGNIIQDSNATRIPVAGTMSLGTIYVDASGSGRVWTSQIKHSGSWAAGAISPTITNTTAGTYADTTNSDSLVAGDYYEWKFADTPSTATMWWYTAAFTATTGHVTLYGGGSVFAVNANVDTYNTLTGSILLTGNTTASVTQVDVKVAGTWSGLGLYLSGNTLNSGAVVDIYACINGVNGTQHIQLTSTSAAGLYDDTTHSDTVQAGDLINLHIVSTGVTSGSLNIQQWYSAITATTVERSDIFVYGNIARSASATVHYQQPIGSIRALTSTTETEKRVKPGFAFNLSNFRVKCSANTCTGSMTVTLRKNAADAIVLTVAAGSTSVVEDSSTIIAFGASDDMSISVTGGTANSATFAYFAYQMDVGFSQGISDSETITEAYGPTTTAALSEASTTSDSFAGIGSSAGALTDSLTATESLVGVAVASLVDALTASENLTGLMQAVGSLLDAVTASETLVGLAAASLSDSMTVADLMQGIANALGTLADALTATETLSGVASASFADVVVTGESLLGATNPTASLSDSVTSADSLNDLVTMTGALADSVTSGEALSGNVIISLALSEALTSLDVLEGIATSAGSLSDILNASELLAPVMSITGTLTEALNSSDALAATMLASLAEAITSTDAVNAAMDAIGSLSDALSAADSLDERATIIGQIVETLLTSDTYIGRMSVFFVRRWVYMNTGSRTVNMNVSARVLPLQLDG